MTEEEAAFDPSLKKKKKKKKTPFDLDAALEGTDSKSSAPADGEAEEKPEEEDGGDDLDLDFSMKKKKKKKKDAAAVKDDDEEEGGAKDSTAAVDDDIDLENFGKKKKKKKPALNMDDLEEALPEEKEDDDLDLESFGKKKKKKKRATVDMGVDDDKDDNKENDLEGSAEDPDRSNEEESNPWLESDRDYTYDELLQRVFGIMRDKNPDMVAGEKKKFVMRPPQVMRVGTKKTAFVNFTEMAKMLHRQPKHLLAFLFAELGTVGAIDGNNQLIIKGRFQQKHIENVLRRYIKEYVTCHTCRSPDTILNKETRLFFLQCMTCHSKCSVQTIKSGFQAVTGKRSANRAKQ